MTAPAHKTTAEVVAGVAERVGLPISLIAGGIWLAHMDHETLAAGLIGAATTYILPPRGAPLAPPILIAVLAMAVNGG
jgi:hypothetical protein